MPARPAVHQVLATLGYGDAIGNEAMGIQRALRDAGFASDIFVQTADPRVEGLTRDYHDLPAACDPDVVLIHHFSIGSHASRVAYAMPGRMMLVYHNITPPEYFVGIHPLLVGLCYTGRRELGAYTSRCSLAVGDSEYNRQELEALGFSPTAVLPVVPDFAHLDVPPNRFIAGQFDDDWTNLLFVGRVIPNKRIDDLVRIFHVYRTRHNPTSRLLIVGSHAGFESYLAQINDLVARLGTPDVHLVGHVTNEELTAYYDVADLFLCASDHEGFCVPLIEAFYKRIPVVAFASSAVPSTMDGAGVLYRDKRPEHVADLLGAVLSDVEIQERIVAEQESALERLRAKDFRGTLLRFVEQVRGTPPRPAPRVVPDFWDQVALVDRLEELRRYRPAIFHALPDEPTP